MQASALQTLMSTSAAPSQTDHSGQSGAEFAQLLGATQAHAQPSDASTPHPDKALKDLSETGCAGLPHDGAREATVKGRRKSAQPGQWRGEEAASKETEAGFHVPGASRSHPSKRGFSDMQHLRTRVLAAEPAVARFAKTPLAPEVNAAPGSEPEFEAEGVGKRGPRTRRDAAEELIRPNEAGAIPMPEAVALTPALPGELPAKLLKAAENPSADPPLAHPAEPDAQRLSSQALAETAPGLASSPQAGTEAGLAMQQHRLRSQPGPTESGTFKLEAVARAQPGEPGVEMSKMARPADGTAEGVPAGRQSKLPDPALRPLTRSLSEQEPLERLSRAAGLQSIQTRLGRPPVEPQPVPGLNGLEDQLRRLGLTQPQGGPRTPRKWADPGDATADSRGRVTTPDSAPSSGVPAAPWSEPGVVPPNSATLATASRAGNGALPGQAVMPAPESGPSNAAKAPTEPAHRGRHGVALGQLMSMSHGQLVRSGLARQAQAEVESVRAIDKLSTAAGLAQASEAASSGAMANIPSLPGGLSSLSAPVGDASSASLQMGQVGALGQTGQTSSSSASPPASQSPMQASLATPIDSPEFHGALGAQVAMMATGGVQMAQLQLNPAEMGPISIQIELEGEEARVEFGADSAATRQIIEAGLPALAAALSEAGLTLSGGGVSQQTPQNPSSAQAFGQEMPHPGGQQGSGGSSHGQERSDRGGSARSEPAPAAAARGRTKGSSGLDLFA